MLLLRIVRQPGLRLGLGLLLGLELVLLTIMPLNAAGSAEFSFADGAFRKVWERPDFPVAMQKATRSFTWGPEGWAFLEEAYAESSGGKRLVQYFDKTRMEITYENANPDGAYYVTNGLLVREMVAGQIQEGNEKFRKATASEQPVAGDPVGNPGPTYRSFKNVASLNQDNRVARKSGETVKATISREGKVGQSEELANKYQVKYTDYNPELGHNIADVFWKFMNQEGQIYQGGQFLNAPVIDWVAAMGFPLTEAYWSRVVVAGQEKDVLIQLFERRVLTYTPDNPDAFKVEMGNVGVHYYTWRYPERPPIAPWSIVNMSNDSICNLITVVLTGQDNLTIELKAGSPKAYKLSPGRYDYKVSGCNIRPKDGSKTFRANQRADWSFTLK